MAEQPGASRRQRRHKGPKHAAEQPQDPAHAIPLWRPPEEKPAAPGRQPDIRDGLRRPVVRLVNERLDEVTYAALVRIDEALRTRAACGDKATLDRIQHLFRTSFRSFGS